MIESKEFKNFMKAVQEVAQKNHDSLCPSLPDPQFEAQEAKKYIKVWKDVGPNKSIHCFIDKNTGLVYKPASAKAPAKGSRANIYDDKTFNHIGPYSVR